MHIEYYLGGYFMSLENTLRFMQNKGIDDKNIDDYRRDRPLKDWLARNNRKDVLCGAIIHPNTPPGYDPYKLIADGILFVTGFFGALNRDGEPTLAENDEARQIKEWLVSGGIDEKDIDGTRALGNYRVYSHLFISAMKNIWQ
ncbi:hypothetical protein MPER_08600 [Moniliophthora perniciosa FA553]|nr:hypothetical protein MPER_08600 [Moniliophthora perniciosa FA553]